MNGNTDFKQLAIDWVEARKDWLSRTHMDIWHFHEPAWREYRSAAYYVALLRAEGFEVEEGSGGMPTAFCATWGKGGPVIGGYAEYDAVPGNSQDPVPFEQPRAGVHRWAAGHTDPHSALGVGALGGLLAGLAGGADLRYALVFATVMAAAATGVSAVHTFGDHQAPRPAIL